MTAACEGGGPVPLLLLHEGPGRLRLRADPPLAPAAAVALLDRLGGLPGIRRAVLRPRTGSFILEGEGPPGSLAATLRGSGLVRLSAPPAPPPLGQAVAFDLALLDAAVARRTEGMLNARSAFALLLLLGAAVQAARGQLGPPAVTLLLAALDRLGPARR